MKKSTTLNLRVDPAVKEKAEDVLEQLGLSMATAIDLYLRQISLTGGIPFAVSLPKVAAAFNADNMTAAEIHAALKAGYDEIEAGNLQDASSAFSAFRDSHR
ncbi:MAG: type II toxin-antitoxin system RelB/DinJ family antitoxin [Ruminococcaceae bacterium]|nr:type II toxin-antitoxin system RelB/DinJ family antitoxin [Oscillospiraceae bacterium]